MQISRILFFPFFSLLSPCISIYIFIAKGEGERLYQSECMCAVGECGSERERLEKKEGVVRGCVISLLRKLE